MENDEAAKWRRRVKRRIVIQEEMSKLGQVSALMCTSILTYYVNGHVHFIENDSYWKVCLESSALYMTLDTRQKARVRKIPFKAYVRLEQGLQAVGRMISLSCEDTNNSELVTSLALLKRWAVIHGSMGSKHEDEVMNYLKWIAKSTQAIALNSIIPAAPTGPAAWNGTIVPFTGPLKFINDMIQNQESRSRGLKLEQARTVSQIANLSRALPYPSPKQVADATSSSVKRITNVPKPMEQRALNEYRRGLAVTRTRNGEKIKNLRTHCSLTNSGCYEASRAQGGRSAYMVKIARLTTDIELDIRILNDLTSRYNFLGQEIISPVNAELIKRSYFDRPLTGRKLTLGDIMFIKTIDITSKVIEIANSNRVCVPIMLKEVLDTVAAHDMTKLGTYNKPYKSLYGMMVFKKPPKGLKFTLKESHLKTKADVSIEAGLKSRLTTSANACVTHFGQQINHVLKGHLSKDPFLRVGFDEPDKLWDALKAYRSHSDRIDFATA